MPSARAATRSPLVLMADAHEWFSRALESVLVPGGYSVVKAYTATGLLQQLELTEPDALILAVDLPGGEGLNLCRMLRADSLVTPSTPIILTQPTPSTRRQTRAALGAGAAGPWGERLDAEEQRRRAAPVSARGWNSWRATTPSPTPPPRNLIRPPYSRTPAPPWPLPRAIRRPDGFGASKTPKRGRDPRCVALLQHC